jgi:hypothetical protein
MSSTPRSFVASALLGLLAAGCGQRGLGLTTGKHEGGSGGGSVGDGGSGGQGSGQSGGISGNGGLLAGGTSGSGQGSGGCPAQSCPAVKCPEGSVAQVFECPGCNDPCGCPCSCWNCDSGTGGAISHGGASVRSSSGGAVSMGGVSGSSGRGGVGGNFGSGGSSVTCIAPPCVPPSCPDGLVLTSSDTCDCSGPCGCPCGCWTCGLATSGTGGIIAGGGASGIGGAISYGGVSGGSGGAPLQHRSTSASCPSQRGPAPQICAGGGGTCYGQPYPYPPGIPTTCSSDSQCTDGVNGRCFPAEGLVSAGGCSYDECSTDSDCGAKIPCICRSSNTDNSANVCYAGGNCAVDSDCGVGGYCSPSVEACYTTAYYCHTASDLCTNDSDCPSVDAGTPSFASTLCAYNTQDKRWECTELTCLPP